MHQCAQGLHRKITVLQYNKRAAYNVVMTSLIEQAVYTPCNLSSVYRVYSDSVPSQTTVQMEERGPAHNRWRGISLFGMSANTWRDFYRSGEMSRSREPRNATSHKITGNKQEHSVPVLDTSRCPHLCPHFSLPTPFLRPYIHLTPGWLPLHVRLLKH